MWTSAPFDPRTISIAFLALLERLSPLERATYILAEAFDYTHEEIAQVVSREVPAVRQLLHRARDHVREGRVRFVPDKAAHEALLGAFVAAASQGDVAALETLLAENVVARTDGGGRVRAALKPVHGASAVSRFLAGVATKTPTGARFEVREVNGWPALIGYVNEAPFTVIQLETDGSRVFEVLVVANPDKLKWLN